MKLLEAVKDFFTGPKKDWSPEKKEKYRKQVYENVMLYLRNRKDDHEGISLATLHFFR